ncbi:MAG: hypothetical protein ACI9W6_003126 [Motiliproteus sp.]|jgi:hypothetical protein
MNTTVTGTYESATQVTNTQEDLIALGIPREQIFVDKKNHQIKIMIPEITEPEIEMILKRHQFSEITARRH